MPLSSAPAALMSCRDRDRRRTAGASAAGSSRGRRFLGGARRQRPADLAPGRLLLVGLAVEGATIPSIHPLLSVHIFVGMLLLGPVALKLASTGYRFVRYYAGGIEYVRLGPPAPLMRFLVAPVLVLSTPDAVRYRRRAPRHPASRPGARPAQGELHRLVRRDDDPRARLHASCSAPRSR